MALVRGCLYRRELGFALVSQGRDLVSKLGVIGMVYTRLRGDKIF